LRWFVPAVLLVLALVTTGWAERAPLSPEKKLKEATHVVTGKVKAVYHRDIQTERTGAGTQETHYLLEIEVDGTDKGDGIAKGDVIYARCWRLKKHGAKGPIPGPSGHFDIPKEGAQVKAFLAKGKYGATGQSDNGYAVVYPNGIETIGQK
jgi:hypothetical protein